MSLLRKKLSNMDDSGTTLIELVVAIPLMAITSGFILLVLAQSAQTNVVNQSISLAGTHVQQIMDNTRGARNCHELTLATTVPDVPVGSVAVISFTSTIDNNSGDTAGCSPGNIMTVKTTANQKINGVQDRILYHSSTSVYITR